MARVHAHPRSMGPKMDSLLYVIFGLPPAQPLRLALVDPTDRYLRAWKPAPPCLQFNQQRVLSPFSSLLLPPSPSSNGRLPPSWRNEKPRLRSWKLEPNSTAIREGVLRAADRCTWNGGESTTCCYLFYLGSELILIDIGNPFGRVPVECE